MRFLVTGGAGFIGSHLSETLLKRGDEVYCIDDFNDYYDPEIKKQNIHRIEKNSSFRLFKGDICDYDFLNEIFRKNSFDAVIHLAARAGVRPSIKNPLLYQRVNLGGTLNLLELSRLFGIKKFILASSSSVYGNNKKVPFSEEDPVDFPISPYAATKKGCELLAFTYHHLYDISIFCLRFFTVYGPRQRPDMAIHKFTKHIFEEEEISLFGDGTSKRDYTFITDIIDGIEKAIEKCEGFRIYNLGESRTTELMELIRILEKRIGKEARIRRLPEQPGDVRMTYADITRAKQELGYSPSVSIEEGISRFVTWYENKMD